MHENRVELAIESYARRFGVGFEPRDEVGKSRFCESIGVRFHHGFVQFRPTIEVGIDPKISTFVPPNWAEPVEREGGV